MLKKIGNIICLFFMITIYCVIFADPEMKILSIDHQLIDEVIANEPFILEVSLQGDSNSIPKVEGLDKFNLLSSSTSKSFTFSSSGQLVKKSFFYELIIKNTGKAVIGPVFINSKKIIESKEIIIVDKKDSINSTNSELLINESEVYVNQKVNFIIRFSCPKKKKIKLDSIIPLSKDIEMYLDKNNPKIFEDEINGVKRTLIEYYGYFYPKYAGSLEILPFQIFYFNYDSFFGFGIFNQKSRILTNSFDLNILDLPDEIISTKAIGNFTKFVASIDREKISSGEAILMTLSIFGDGNFEKISELNLDISDEIKKYDSKNFLKKDNDITSKKFEYVLQINKEGIYEIPSQKFTFFDPYEKKYKTLMTQKLKVEIFPIQVKNNNLDKNLFDNNPLEKGLNDLDNEIKFVLESKKEWVCIPWNYYFVIVFLLLSLFLSKLLFSFKKRRKFNKFSKIILDEAMNQISTEYNNRNYDKIYKLFRRAISMYLEEKNEISNERVVESLKSKNFDSKYLDFYEKLNLQLLSLTNFSPDTINTENIIKKIKELFELLSNKINSRNIKQFIIIVFFSVSFNLFSTESQKAENYENNVVQTVKKLRNTQKNSGLTQSKIIDQLVNRLKKKVNFFDINDNLDFNFINYLKIFPLIFWQILAIFSLFLMLFFRIQPKFRVIVGLIILISWSHVILLAYKDLSQYAVVNKSQVDLFLGPNDSMPKKGFIKFLAEVKIIKNYSNWYFVKSSFGSGWVKSDDLEII